MRTTLSALLLCLPCVVYAGAAEQMTLRVADRMVSEYATCAAYYGVLSRSVAGHGGMALAAQYDSQRDKAITFALVSARKGHSDEQAHELVTGRIDSALQEMYGVTGGDLEHLAPLTAAHASRCRTATEQPRSFADEIIAQTPGQDDTAGH